MSSFAQSKTAFVSTIAVTAINLILFVVAIAGNWECMDDVTHHDKMCYKLYHHEAVVGAREHEKAPMNSDTEDHEAYVAVFTFLMLATLASVTNLILMLLTLMGSGPKYPLTFLLISAVTTLFSIMMWSMFIAFQTEGLELGYGFVAGTVGSTFSIYPLIYTAAVYFSDSEYPSYP